MKHAINYVIKKTLKNIIFSTQTSRNKNIMTEIELRVNYLPKDVSSIHVLCKYLLYVNSLYVSIVNDFKISGLNQPYYASLHQIKYISKKYGEAKVISSGGRMISIKQLKDKNPVVSMSTEFEFKQPRTKSR